MNVELTFYWIQKWRNFVSFIDATHLITSISFNSFRKFSGDHENVWEWSDSFLNSHKHIKIVRVKVHRVHGMFKICPKIIHSLLVHSLWEPGKTHTNANHSLSDVKPQNTQIRHFFARLCCLYSRANMSFQKGEYMKEIYLEKKKENTFSIKKKVRLKKIRQKTRSRSGKKERFKKNDSGQEKRKKTHSRPRK